jgi:hypothetical protein
MDKKCQNKTEKTMAFKKRGSIISQIIINNNIIEEISTFSYLGYTMAYRNEKVITVKISEFLQITGIINRTLNSLKYKITLD